jgi:hypothetical protein
MRSQAPPIAVDVTVVGSVIAVWHTCGGQARACRGTLRAMSPIKKAAGTVANSMTPDATLFRVRFRISLDMLLTAILTIIAIGLAIGYQVMSRWGDRNSDSR